MSEEKIIKIWHNVLGHIHYGDSYYVYWKQLPQNVINYLQSIGSFDLNTHWNSSATANTVDTSIGRVHETYFLTNNTYIQDAFDFFGLKWKLVDCEICEYEYYGEVNNVRRYKSLGKSFEDYLAS